MDNHAETTETLARHAKGEISEFAALYERIAPRLYTWARLRVRPSLGAVLSPEDLVQEVWWRAFSQFANFDPDKGTFRAWLFTIATRQLLNGMRSLRSRQVQSTRLVTSSDVANVGRRISQDLAQNDLLDKVHTIVSAMPADSQSLVIHCGLEGLPTTEVAAMLGLSVEAARKRWQRLRQELRRAIPEGQEVLGY